MASITGHAARRVLRMDRAETRRACRFSGRISGRKLPMGQYSTLAAVFKPGPR
ncbi:hypothetical protein [Phaeobacter sp. J2-8]|uniref:hypothetical protein n=1 Tax=Phaeobacter sp. J2-8 TaxID=2931394 RepID=UPI001FD28604|nr:hypothetical protein [Phaeobacter sp. J2-8]MCJ7874495.1 hypothetical protein [Phaeobacter sp. J2-8]